MDVSGLNIACGLLIMFDGIDGVGKTTQLQLVETLLREKHITVISRRNPGGTPIGEELRSAMLRPFPRPPLTDLYISAAIQEALIEEIKSERNKRSVILLDRSPLSIAAYQIYGSGINEEIGWQFVASGMDRLKPDLTFIYRCDPDTALKRARQQSANVDYFESKPINFFERVEQGYLEAAKRYDVVVIDANHSIKDVHAKTMMHIEKLLKLKTNSDV